MLRTILLFILAIAALYFLFQLDLGTFGKLDFAQYWSAAQLLFSEVNPYDSKSIFELERQYLSITQPILIWNPPIIFPLIYPLAFIGFDLASRLWLLGSSAIIFCSVLLSRATFLEEGSRLKIILSVIFAFTFFPFALVLDFGQISTVLLLGSSIFLLFYLKEIDKSQLNRSFCSGLGLSLTFIKPHLLYLVYLYILLSNLRRKNLQVTIGLCYGLVLLIALSVIISPEAMTWYLESLKKPPIDWRTPTLGNLLQSLTGIHTFWVRALPSFISALVLVLLFFSGKIICDKTIILFLIPISLFTSPYGWTYDHILLFSVAYWLISKFGDLWGSSYPASLIIILLFLSNIALMIPVGSLALDNYLWFPGLYVLLSYFGFKLIPK